MTGRAIALTGVPRGGTTLACRLLGECRDTVALFEPMDVSTLPVARNAALDQIGAFFEASRQQLMTRGTALSKHRGGAMTDNPFDATRGADGRRSLQVEHGEVALGRPTEHFSLVIKHNAAFAALLPELATRFMTLAVVRNPLAVLASWNTVDLPVADGRLPAGERLDPALASCLAATPDRLTRQCWVLHWFFDRFVQHLPDGAVMRYEDIVASRGRVLRLAAGCEGDDRIDLQARNASPLYAAVDIAALEHALYGAASIGKAAWTHWYGAEEIARSARELETVRGG